MKYLFTKANRKKTTYFMALLMLTQTLSCQYYKIGRISGGDEEEVKLVMGDIHKNFIIHHKTDKYELTDISVDSLSLKGELRVPERFIFFSVEGKKKYSESTKHILNEVHIYLQEGTRLLGPGPISVSLKDIKEIVILDHDTGKTLVVGCLSVGGVTIAALILIVIYALITKSSCPYVYVQDGEGFVFEGEIFGGAIGSNLVRSDYMPLPDARIVDGHYSIRISNELKERQYTDLAELVVINHSMDETVLLDISGNPYIISKSVSPDSAYSFNGTDLKPIIAKKDKSYYFFNEPEQNQNGLIMKFKKPEGALQGKLVFNAKNSLWFDYQVGQFLEYFGDNFDEWMEDQKKLSAEVRRQSMQENDFPLSLQIKQNGKWVPVEYIPTVGPLASRDFVVPLDFDNSTGDYIEIKMETGFMFWELDQVAMDFTEKSEFSLETILPEEAVGTRDIDWKKELSAIDGISMAQERTGEVTEISFRSSSPPPNGMKQTVFLHSHGYYELVREFTGSPNLTELNKFKRPGYFSSFSRENYLKVREQMFTQEATSK